MKNLWMKTALLAALCVAAAGCSRRQQAPEELSIRVRTVTVAEDTAGVTRRYTGVIEEASTSVLSFPLAGTVRGVYVREGERVNAGKTLAQLEAANLQSTHEAAQATLGQAEDAMRRLQQLHDKGSLPEIQYVEAQTKLAQARAMAEVAAKNLADSRLAAPFAGVIGRRSAEAGENVLPGQPVLSLYDTHTVMAKISVPEGEIASIRIGDSAEIRLDNRNGALMPGMVCNAAVQSPERKPVIVLPAQAVRTHRERGVCRASPATERQARRTG